MMAKIEEGDHLFARMKVKSDPSRGVGYRLSQNTKSRHFYFCPPPKLLGLFLFIKVRFEEMRFVIFDGWVFLAIVWKE